MKCKEFEKLVLDYIEGELDKKKEEEFVNHMEECENCKKLFKDFKYILEMSRKIETPPLPEDFSIKIPEERKRRKIIIPKVALAIACLFFILLPVISSFIHVPKKNFKDVIFSDSEILEMVNCMSKKEIDYFFDTLLTE
ncbi:MAG TPA: hypothetical protein ENF61_00085 [Firmicutes bacterium]|nr:hypothetical protein [Bacillota bacterium]